MKYEAKKKSAVKASILMFFCTLGLCCGAFPLLPTKLTHPKTTSRVEKQVNQPRYIVNNNTSRL